MNVVYSKGQSHLENGSKGICIVLKCACLLKILISTNDFTKNNDMQTGKHE